MINLPNDQLHMVKAILSDLVPECQVWAFGSRVKGNAQTFSDLDLVVIDSKPMDWRRIEALKDRFSASNLPIIVDVVDWHTLDDGFKRVIQQQYEIVQ